MPDRDLTIGGRMVSSQWKSGYGGLATPTVDDGDQVEAGWQAILGASYAVTPKISLALDGRLKSAFGGFKFPGSGAGRQISAFRYRTMSVSGSVRYAFAAAGQGRGDGGRWGVCRAARRHSEGRGGVASA